MIRAFSLLELLAVIAVIAVITAILAPVLKSARLEAYKSGDLSNMRQCGAARALYMEHSDGECNDLSALVSGKMIPIPLVSSRVDTSSIGIANVIVTDLSKDSKMYAPLITSYKRSFVTVHDYLIGDNNFQKFIGPQPASGWLVRISLSNSKTGGPSTGDDPSLCRYERLTFDGGVVERNRFSVSTAGGNAWSPIFLYADGDAKWIQSVLTK